MLNRPTSQTFINGLKYNNKNTCKFTEKLRIAKQVWLVHRPCPCDKKLWFCVGGKHNLVLSTGSIMRIRHREEIRKLTFRALPSSERIDKTKLSCDKALAAEFYVAIYFLNSHPTFQLSSCHLPNNRIYDGFPNEFMFCVSILRRSAYKYQTKYNCSSIIPGFILNKLRDDINSLVKCTLQALQKNEKQSLATVL